MLLDAYHSWSADRAVRLGAGIAYYSLFALVPVLFLSISLAGILFGRETADTTVEENITDLVGPEIADIVTQAIDGLRQESANSLLPLVSVGALLFTATLLFVAWKDVVDIIWDVPRETGVLAGARRRLFGLAAVIGSGLLLSLMIFAETLVGSLDRRFDSAMLDVLFSLTGSFVPAVLGAAFLLVLLKYTPDVHVEWRSVWLAALVTMVMLAIGAWAYGLYLGTVGFTSSSGIAGTVLLGLAFIYYASQILLYGVEITKQVHERSLGPGVPTAESTTASTTPLDETTLASSESDH